MAESELDSSPLAEALARVGDRWTLLVVEALLTKFSGIDPLASETLVHINPRQMVPTALARCLTELDHFAGNPAQCHDQTSMMAAALVQLPTTLKTGPERKLEPELEQMSLPSVPVH